MRLLKNKKMITVDGEQFIDQEHYKVWLEDFVNWEEEYENLKGIKS